MKTATAIFLLSFCISASSILAQEKSRGVVLLNSSGNTITLNTPAAVTNNSILFPGTLGLQGALMYISSVAAGPIGTTTWLNPGSNGQVLTLSAGVPTWATPTTGTVTSVSIGTLSNGITGSIATGTTTPAISLGLGNITPTTVNGLTLTALATGFSIAGGTTSKTLIVSNTATVSGTNTGDQTITLTGNVTGSGTGSFAATIAANAVTYAKMQAVSATSRLLGSSSTTTAVQEISLGAGLSLAGTTLTATGSGGTVTSVGLSLPSIFSVSGSPVTASGTLTGTLATQSANLIFAGPSSGAAATPTFRALTSTDIPALPYMTSVGLALPSIFSVSGSPVTTSGTLTGTLATQSANLIFAGPSSGVAAAPTFRAIVPADMPVFVASGVSHASGTVPDPGSTAGTTRFLREDATWAIPAASTGWLLGGNSLPSSNIFGTTSATNVIMQASSTQAMQLTGVATANYDVGSVLFGTTATPIVSTGDKIVINGGNFSLNSETNTGITREIVFRGTAGSGNLRIRGDGNDLYWQGGGGKNLQMGAYWQINLLGQLQTASLQALSNSTTFAHVYIPLQQAGDPGLVIQNASGQTSDPFQIQAFNATQGSGTILTRVTSAGFMGIGSTTPTAPLHLSLAVTASSGNATGMLVNQTLTAAANNDVLYGVNITPTFTNGASTGLTNYSLRSVYAGTLLNGAAIRGEATGNGGANGDISGIWGIATSTTQGSNTNAGTGVCAEGNSTTTDANSNIALHIFNGEFAVGRQASSAANDNTSGNNILVANEDDANGLTDQGPSGIVDITDGGNPGSGAPTTGTLQVFNRYAKTHSIILITPMTGGTGIPGPNEATTYRISGRTNGSFSVDVRRSLSGGGAGTSGTWRVAFLIVNPGK